MTADGVFAHPDGRCESDDVGAGTRVWAFAHVLSGAVIGADCNISDHVFVENDDEIDARRRVAATTATVMGPRVT